MVNTLMSSITMAFAAADDSFALLQTIAGVQRHSNGQRILAALAAEGKDTICVEAAAGDITPVSGSFTAKLSQQAVEVAAGHVAEEDGSFCVPKQDVLLLQRTYGLSTVRDFDAALAPKTLFSLPKTVTPTDAPTSEVHDVCIVGGGIGGLMTAYELHRRSNGNRSALIFEATSRIGGKIETSYKGGQLFDADSVAVKEGWFGSHDVVPQEMGACYLSPDYVRTRAVLKAVGLENQTMDLTSRTMHSNSLPSTVQEFAAAAILPQILGSLPKECKILGQMSQYKTLHESRQLSSEHAEHLEGLTSAILGIAKDKNQTMPAMQASCLHTTGKSVAHYVLSKLAEYTQKHEAIFGTYDTGRPPQPSVPLTGTFGEWLDENGFTGLRPLFAMVQTSQGYADIDDVPAFYGLYWCTPLALQLIPQQLGFPTDAPGVQLLLPGFTEMVKRLADLTNADIRLETPISSIDRSGVEENGFSELSSSSGQIFKCRNVVLNVPVPEMIRTQMLDLTDAERNIFSKIGSCNAWQAFFFRAENTSGLSAIDAWADRFKPVHDGHSTAGKPVVTRITPRVIEGHMEWKDASAEEFVSLSLYVNTLTEEESLVKVRTELGDHIGLTNIEKLDSKKTSDYFCHFNVDAVAEGMPWKVDDLQGSKNTWFVGGSVSFEAIEHIISYVQDTVVPKILLHA